MWSQLLSLLTGDVLGRIARALGYLGTFMAGRKVANDGERLRAAEARAAALQARTDVAEDLRRAGPAAARDRLRELALEQELERQRRAGGL